MNKLMISTETYNNGYNTSVLDIISAIVYSTWNLINDELSGVGWLTDNIINCILYIYNLPRYCEILGQMTKQFNKSPEEICELLGLSPGTGRDLLIIMIIILVITLRGIIGKGLSSLFEHLKIIISKPTGWLLISLWLSNWLLYIVFGAYGPWVFRLISIHLLCLMRFFAKNVENIKGIWYLDDKGNKSHIWFINKFVFIQTIIMFLITTLIVHIINSYSHWNQVFNFLMCQSIAICLLIEFFKDTAINLLKGYEIWAPDFNKYLNIKDLEKTNTVVAYDNKIINKIKLNKPNNYSMIKILHIFNISIDKLFNRLNNYYTYNAHKKSIIYHNKATVSDKALNKITPIRPKTLNPWYFIKPKAYLSSRILPDNTKIIPHIGFITYGKLLTMLNKLPIVKEILNPYGTVILQQGIEYAYGNVEKTKTIGLTKVKAIVWSNKYTNKFIFITNNNNYILITKTDSNTSKYYPYIPEYYTSLAENMCIVKSPKITPINKLSTCLGVMHKVFNIIITDTESILQKSNKYDYFSPTDTHLGGNNSKLDILFNRALNKASDMRDNGDNSSDADDTMQDAFNNEDSSENNNDNSGYPDRDNSGDNGTGNQNEGNTGSPDKDPSDDGSSDGDSSDDDSDHNGPDPYANSNQDNDNFIKKYENDFDGFIKIWPKETDPVKQYIVSYITRLTPLDVYTWLDYCVKKNKIYEIACTYHKIVGKAPRNYDINNAILYLSKDFIEKPMGDSYFDFLSAACYDAVKYITNIQNPMLVQDTIIKLAIFNYCNTNNLSDNIVLDIINNIKNPDFNKYSDYFIKPCVLPFVNIDKHTKYTLNKRSYNTDLRNNYDNSMWNLKRTYCGSENHNKLMKLNYQHNKLYYNHIDPSLRNRFIEAGFLESIDNVSPAEIICIRDYFVENNNLIALISIYDSLSVKNRFKFELISYASRPENLFIKDIEGNSPAQNSLRTRYRGAKLALTTRLFEEGIKYLICIDNYRTAVKAFFDFIDDPSNANTLLTNETIINKIKGKNSNNLCFTVGKPANKPTPVMFTINDAITDDNIRERIESIKQDIKLNYYCINHQDNTQKLEIDMFNDKNYADFLSDYYANRYA